MNEPSYTYFKCNALWDVFLKTECHLTPYEDTIYNCFIVALIIALIVAPFVALIVASIVAPVAALVVASTVLSINSIVSVRYLSYY